MGIAFWKSSLFFALILLFGIGIFPSQRQIGLFYSYSGLFNKARFYLAQQYHRDPEDAANTLRYLDSLAYHGEPELFIRIGNEFLQRNPGNEKVHMRMADYFEGRLEFENAAEHWAAIVRQNPEELEVRDKLVSYYLVSKDLEALRGIYEYERKKSQASADLYEDLGNLYVMAGDTGKAVEVYQEMAARFPRNERALTRLLDISEYRGEREKALTYSRQLADYYPDNRDYALRYAQKVIQYQPAEAEKLIQGWIQKFSQTQDFLLILAEFYIQQGKKKEAVDVLQSILQKNPQNTAVIRSLGENLYSLHQYEDARELLENYHARTGGTYHTHHLLGDVYNALGNASAGRREYEEALRQLRE